MREIRPSGSEGGGTETNLFSLPLSLASRMDALVRASSMLHGRGVHPTGVRPLYHGLKCI